MLMNRSFLVSTPSRFKGGVLAVLQFAVVVSLALIAAFLITTPAHAVTIDMVTVGNPGNAPDPASGNNMYGAVTGSYRIGKYEVKIQQYTDFLNAVDPNGTNPYGLYNNSMGADDNIKGILYSSGSASGQKYSPIGNSNRPIAYVSWFDAARFANWMHNGQGASSTETGAYTLVGGQTRGEPPAKNLGAQFYLPTESEWYKAAFYSPVLNSGAGGYYTYATQSNSTPGNTIGGDGSQANYYANDVYAVTQSAEYDPAQSYLTAVGAFTNSASYYGTFDQTGNLWEWIESTGGSASERGLRGGSWGSDLWTQVIIAGARAEGSSYGFRLASPVAVPEPSAIAMALAGIASGGFSMWRRRKRA
jgi:formylglycine-generating enzyme required for sulfatase activity